MPKYQYYSRKTVSAAETDFFDESRAEAANNELDTNLPKDHRVTKDFTVNRLIAYLPFEEVQAASASTATQLDDQKILVDEGVITVKVGDEAEKYFRLAECLDNISAQGAVNLAQGTAADDQYQLASLNVGDGSKGLPVDISIPAETNFNVTLKTVSSPVGIDVTVVLSGEHPA